MFIPVPVFWALFDQQSTRWTFQADKMSGRITDSVSIHPDQLQLVNSVLILLFVPMFEFAIYPFVCFRYVG
jgi:solute carrier family 15 (oligopeptide transporter), member 1